MGDEKKEKNQEIIIDYENIDVQDIMRQIREKIANQPQTREPEQSYPKDYLELSTPSPAQPEGPPGWKAKMKNVLLKVLKPFSPFISKIQN